MATLTDSAVKHAIKRVERSRKEETLADGEGPAIAEPLLRPAIPAAERPAEALLPPHTTNLHEAAREGDLDALTRALDAEVQAEVLGAERIVVSAPATEGGGVVVHVGIADLVQARHGDADDHGGSGRLPWPVSR